MRLFWFTGLNEGQVWQVCMTEDELRVLQLHRKETVQAGASTPSWFKSSGYSRGGVLSIVLYHYNAFFFLSRYLSISSITELHFKAAPKMQAAVAVSSCTSLAFFLWILARRIRGSCASSAPGPIRHFAL